MKNFWQKLPKPIYALAPMAGFTDSAFRQVCKSFGADVVYSEMASATALVYNPKKTLAILKSVKKESPYIIQLFGSNPDHFAQAVKLLTDKKTGSKFQVPSFRIPDGIDINFGCPVKKVARQGAGAVLMNNLKLARQIIEAVINNTKLPVSIKCRSQVGEVNILNFLDYIKDLLVSAVMIHGRTLKQGHGGPVDWQIIKEARQHFSGIILANGGVGTAPIPDAGTLTNPLLISPLSRGRKEEGARERGVNDVKIYADWLLAKTGADGVGIGQGALGRPWIFSQIKSPQPPLSRGQIIKIILKHAKLVNKLKSGQGIVEMRKHLCWYARGLPGAKKLREKLVKVENLEKIKKTLNDYIH